MPHPVTHAAVSAVTNNNFFISFVFILSPLKFIILFFTFRKDPDLGGNDGIYMFVRFCSVISVSLRMFNIRMQDDIFMGENEN